MLELSNFRADLHAKSLPQEHQTSAMQDAEMNPKGYLLRIISFDMKKPLEATSSLPRKHSISLTPSPPHKRQKLSHISEETVVTTSASVPPKNKTPSTSSSSQSTAKIPRLHPSSDGPKPSR